MKRKAKKSQMKSRLSLNVSFVIFMHAKCYVISTQQGDNVEKFGGYKSPCWAKISVSHNNGLLYHPY